MKLILFLDERGGMLFNRRRQSQDRKAREYILNMTAGKRLLMNPYSAKQFKEAEGIILTETPQKDASREDYVLIENLPVTLSDVDEVILILWNTLYPSDVSFDTASLAREGFSLKETEEFAGMPEVDVLNNQELLLIFFHVLIHLSLP